VTWMPRPRAESGHFCLFAFVVASKIVIACSQQGSNNTRGHLMHRTAEGDGPREGTQGASIPDLTFFISLYLLSLGHLVEDCIPMPSAT
jgi:hypothetical protein